MYELALLTLLLDCRENTTKRTEVLSGTAAISQVLLDKEVVTISLKVADGWSLFANPVGNKWLADYRTTVTVARNGKPVEASVEYPRGKPHRDGSDEYLTYESNILIRATISRGDPTERLSVEVTHHGINRSTRITTLATRLTLFVAPDKDRN